MRLHRLDYDDGALGEWAQCVTAQPWKEAYVFFKHDEAAWRSGPPAVAAFVEAFLRRRSVAVGSPVSSSDHSGRLTEVWDTNPHT